MRAFLPLAAVVCLLSVVDGGAAGPTTGPLVRPVDLNPLVVRGLRFRAGETVSVRVVVRGGPTVAKSVRAGSRGGFTARFAVAIGPCTPYAIRASGSRGRAVAPRPGYTANARRQRRMIRHCA